MGDVFQALRNLTSVARVSNLPGDSALPLQAVFFICPPLSGQGFQVNEHGTGLKGAYRTGLSASTLDRWQRVQRFAAEAAVAGVTVDVTAIVAAADAVLLFPTPAAPPAMPDVPGLRVVSNLEAVLTNFPLIGELRRDRPWGRVPQRWVAPEIERLRAMLPPSVPDHLARDFVERIFAGFALDGLLLRQGWFGDSPVVLGVESPGVTVLQNAALNRQEWLPMVQLG